MKRDGFGIKHRDECRGPAWTTAQARRAGTWPLLVQRCRGCGVVWREGDPAGPAQARTGYAVEGRR